MVSKVGKLRIESDLAPLSTDDHVFHVIIQDLSRDTTQVSEGLDMAIHKALKSTVINKLHIHCPREAQNHHKGINCHGRPIGLTHLKISPVYLGLKPRLGFKTDIGHIAQSLLDTAHMPLQSIVASLVAHLPDAIKEPGGLIAVLLQKVFDRPLERVQNGCLPFSLSVLGHSPSLQILLDSVAVNSQLLCDISQTIPLTAQSKYFHKHLHRNHGRSLL